MTVSLAIWCIAIGMIVAIFFVYYNRTILGGFVRTLIESGAPTSIAELAVGGKELISLGYSGADIGILLRKLIIAAMSGRVKNTSDALIEYIK